MNACVPTNKSFCSSKRVEPKPRSSEAIRRMEFYRTHKIDVITDPKNGIATIRVSKKEVL